MWGKVTGVFSDTWSKISSVFDSNNKNSVIYKVKNAFVTLKTLLANPINAIIGIFNKFLGGVVTAVNNIIDVLNNFKVNIPSWVPNIGGKTVGFNLGKLSFTDIPTVALAQGAVIPPNKEFMAILGDQKQGVNIETPLDTMVDAFKKAINESGTTQKEPIVLQLNGRAVAQVVWDEEAKKYKQTGFGLAY